MNMIFCAPNEIIKPCFALLLCDFRRLYREWIKRKYRVFIYENVFSIFRVTRIENNFLINNISVLWVSFQCIYEISVILKTRPVQSIIAGCRDIGNVILVYSVDRVVVDDSYVFRQLVALVRKAK